MKRIIASIGFMAIGATSIYAQQSAENVKPWSISGTLRGFYDDNYATQVSANKHESWGVEVAPSARVKYDVENTKIAGSYAYGMKWYEKPNTEDQSHKFQIDFSHSFSKRYALRAGDTFVVAQEPDILSTGIVSTPLRSEGSNIRNTGSFGFLTSVTENFGIDLSYDNNLYSYQDEYRARQLDRDEHLAGVDLRWKVIEPTVAVLGYRFGETDYSHKLMPGSTTVQSSLRNSRSHYFLAGVDQNFTQELRGSVRVGAQSFDYFNQGATQTSPYADSKISYEYLKGSSIAVGVKHMHNATDIIGADPSDPVLDSEATVPYVAWTHKITPLLTSTVVGQFQRATFNGGSFDNQNEDYYTISANLGYEVNKFLTVETGYSFDDLESSVGRAYTRNRVYLGLRATY
jgi:hypothetical protein